MTVKSRAHTRNTQAHSFTAQRCTAALPQVFCECGAQPQRLSAGTVPAHLFSLILLPHVFAVESWPVSSTPCAGNDQPQPIFGQTTPRVELMRFLCGRRRQQQPRARNTWWFAKTEVKQLVPDEVGHKMVQVFSRFLEATFSSSRVLALAYEPRC